jgi:hypothetical protein
MLTWKGIEATIEIASSPNAKIVMVLRNRTSPRALSLPLSSDRGPSHQVGNSKESLPLIMGDSTGGSTVIGGDRGAALPHSV